MIDTLFIFGAEYLFLLSITGAVALFWQASPEVRRKMLIFGLFVFPVAFILSLIARELYFNPRPFVVGEFTPLIPHSADNGFPSDHTLLTGTVAAFAFIFSRRYGLWLWTVALAVGLSRVYVGVHHLADILGSVFIALFSTWVTYAIIEKWTSKSTNSPSL